MSAAERSHSGIAASLNNSPDTLVTDRAHHLKVKLKAMDVPNDIQGLLLDTALVNQATLPSHESLESEWVEQLCEAANSDLELLECSRANMVCHVVASDL